MKAREVSGSTAALKQVAILITVTVALGLLYSPSALSQVNTGALRGTVQDPTSAVIPNADVSILNVATGVERTTRSNEAGVYVFLNLLPGTYTVRCSAAGFSSYEKTGIRVDAQADIVNHIAMAVGQSSEKVTVEATQVTVETATTGLGSTIQEREIKELPIASRNFTQLLLLDAGVSPVDVSMGGGGWMQQPFGGYVLPSIDGHNSRTTTFVIDGIQSNSNQFGGYSVAPSVDEIEELKIQKHSDQADIGQTTGGLVNLVTKAGTNSLHGTGWWFVRNDKFNARDPFRFVEPYVPPFRQNQFGGNVGGPVWIPKLYNGKNRTHFFVSYEGGRLHRSSSNLELIPTPENINGDLRYAWGSTAINPIYDPYSTRPDPNNAQKTVRDPFPNNIIPTARLDSRAVKYNQTIYPQPMNTGVAGTNFLLTSPFAQTLDQVTFRVDQELGNGKHAFFRMTDSHTNVLQSVNLPGNQGQQGPTALNWVASYRHTLSPNSILHAFFGKNQSFYSLHNVMTTVDHDAFLPTIWDASFVCGLPAETSFGTKHCVFPSVSNGYPAIDEQGVFVKSTNSWQSGADWSYVRGKHTIKAGGTFATTPWTISDRGINDWYSATQTEDPQNPGNTGYALASQLLNAPSYIARSFRTDGSQGFYIYGAYVGDQWQVSNRLTVNVGIRWDMTATGKNYFNHIGPTNNYGGTIDFTRGVYVLQSLPPGCLDTKNVPPCIPGMSGSTLPAHMEVSPSGKVYRDTVGNIAPRIGIAFRLNDKTAIRGGYNRAYDNWTYLTNTYENIMSWPNGGSVSLANINQSSGVPTVSGFGNPLGNAPPDLPAPTPFQQAAWSRSLDYTSPYSDQWNIGIQHQVTNTILVSANYVGSTDHRVLLGYTGNVAKTPGPGNWLDRAPFPWMTSSWYLDNAGRSWYHALQVTANKRFSQGLSFLVNYTWSKSMDYAPGGLGFAEGGQPQDVYNIQADKAVSAWDLPHIFKASWIYELPFGKGKQFSSSSRVVNGVIGGWQVSGILTLRSGIPFTLTAPGDIANIGNYWNNYERPNVNGDWHAANQSPSAWFNTSAFSVPAQYTFGNTGRNIMRGDTLQSIDLSAFRHWRMGEKTDMQFRVEAFNAFNSVSYALPNTTVTSPNFGRIFGVGLTPRQLQMAIKFLF